MDPLYLSRVTVLLMAVTCFYMQLRYYRTPELKNFHRFWIWGLLGGLLALFVTLAGVALP